MRFPKLIEPYKSAKVFGIGTDTNPFIPFVQSNIDYRVLLSLNLIDNIKLQTKFGKNRDIDIASVPADIWNGLGPYTGHDCTEAQTLDISAGANDTGTLVTSGTADNSSDTNLKDSAATFITDGVAVGDAVANTTQGFYGIVSEVISEEELTVYTWEDTDEFIANSFHEGDSYIIARATSTGAGLIKIIGLDGNYDNIFEYVVLNGLTNVTTTQSFIRQDRGRVIISGSSQNNEAAITAQQTTSSIITMVMPAGSGQTAIACYTVPRNKVLKITALYGDLTISGNQASSAQLEFQVRARGGSWQTKRFGGVSNSKEYKDADTNQIIINEFSDIRFRCSSVSRDNSIVTAYFDYYEIDKNSIILG